MGDKKSFADVIASRMYYSMFLLVKCYMVYNQENNIDCNEKLKMPLKAAVHEHSLAKDCMCFINYCVGMDFSDLYDLRITADYDQAKVDTNELDEAYTSWKQRHQEWINNLKSVNRLIL